MTNIELTQITQLLHNDPDRFYTDLSAHNKGFTTNHKQIFSLYNLSKHTILDYISSQLPHLLEQYIRYEGKLTTKVPTVDVYYNYKLYSDAVINDDITYNRLHLYANIVDNLSIENQSRFYQQLDKNNYTLILNNDLVVPVQWLKDEYLLLYVNYMSSHPNYENFLVELNEPLFIFDNYKYLANTSVDKYIMKNVTIISEQTAKSLLNTGLSVKSIMTNQPNFLPYIIPYINTIDEFKVMVSLINSSTSMKTIGHILEHFPLFRSTIEKRLERIIYE